MCFLSAKDLLEICCGRKIMQHSSQFINIIVIIGMRQNKRNVWGRAQFFVGENLQHKLSYFCFKERGGGGGERSQSPLRHLGILGI